MPVDGWRLKLLFPMIFFSSITFSLSSQVQLHSVRLLFPSHCQSHFSVTLDKSNIVYPKYTALSTCEWRTPGTKKNNKKRPKKKKKKQKKQKKQNQQQKQRQKQKHRFLQKDTVGCLTGRFWVAVAAVVEILDFAKTLEEEEEEEKRWRPRTWSTMSSHFHLQMKKRKKKNPNNKQKRKWQWKTYSWWILCCIECVLSQERYCLKKEICLV